MGAKNGQKNGLSLLIDVDSFEYGQYPKSARGFILALSSMSERPMVRQEGKIDFQQKKTYLKIPTTILDQF